jgi:hypothetical protein
MGDAGTALTVLGGELVICLALVWVGGFVVAWIRDAVTGK